MKTAVQFITLTIDKRENIKMAIEFNREAYNKVYNDLDKFRDYCRFEGKVFNEKDLYKSDAPVWIAYNKYQGWLRAKARNASRNINQRRK
jgi:hypothetical protein|tara:strand:- start:284 stop:553 length:270 start_codon:yes stop_codon:yes gene_type:complete